MCVHPTTIPDPQKVNWQGHVCPHQQSTGTFEKHEASEQFEGVGGIPFTKVFGQVVGVLNGFDMPKYDKICILLDSHVDSHV